MVKLSVIIPFGTSKERSFIMERTIEKIYELKNNDIEVIFVEGFSSFPDENIKREIEKNGHIYIKESFQTKYNLGACRNLGVQHASAPVVTFLDVDYYLSNNCLNKILQVIDIKNIARAPNRFLILPCAFLTEEGTRYLHALDKEKWDAVVQYDIISQKRNLVKFLSMASSTCVLNRHKFLELGGNDPAYVGHGYEDFDLYYRLFKGSFPVETIPEKLDYDPRSWNFTEYKGFRSLFSVAGYEAAFYGIYLYHLWHDEPNNNGYLDNREINHKKFYNRIKKYFILADGPDPLLAKEAINKKVMAFMTENSSVYRSIRGIIPYIGKIICKNESSFFNGGIFDKGFFYNYIKNNEIERVFFPNPYGNENRLEIYKYVRSKNIPYICYDRGALPDSWFFDVNGFNYDSCSYFEKNWNIELTAEQEKDICEYIDYIKTSNNFLEKQGEEVGVDALKQKLGVRSKKIVFVPLQVESDTVIKYFSREPFYYYDFLDAINSIAAKIEKYDWVVIAKKHPLMINIDKKKYDNIKFASDDSNINELVKMSDVVLTINSGVGLYAMIFEKPCLLAGNAFYSFNGLNYNVYSEDDIIKYILYRKIKVDREKMLRFVYYLYKNFYSYGKTYYKITQEGNRIRNTVSYIDFYKIAYDSNILLDGMLLDKFIYKNDVLPMRPYSFQLAQCKKKPMPTKQISQASSTLSAQKPTANLAVPDNNKDRKNILLVTDIPFWKDGLGNRSRISNLCLELGDKFNLYIFFLDPKGQEKAIPPQITPINGKIFISSNFIQNKETKIVGTQLPMNRDLSNLSSKDSYNSFFYFISKSVKYDCIIYEYITTAYLKNAVPYRYLSILDTHDIMAIRKYKLNGEHGCIDISLKEEIAIYNNFDSILLIQDEEYRKVVSLEVKSIPLCCKHHIAGEYLSQSEEIISFGFIGSGNSINYQTISWFIENVWNVISSDKTALHIFGNVCKYFSNLGRNIFLHGVVADRNDIYSRCDVFVNPVSEGSGLKIKTVEALAFGKPLLASPEAVAGITKPDECGIIVAHNRAEFIEGALFLIYDGTLRKRLSHEAFSAAKLQFSAKACYEPVIKLIEAY